MRHENEMKCSCGAECNCDGGPGRRDSRAASRGPRVLVTRESPGDPGYYREHPEELTVWSSTGSDGCLDEGPS